MIRRMTLVLLFVALPLLTVGAVPNGVNLHNGYVLLVNNIRYEGERTDPLRVRLGLLAIVHRAVIDKDGTLTFNHCCILAGSHYVISVNAE